METVPIVPPSTTAQTSDANANADFLAFCDDPASRYERGEVNPEDEEALDTLYLQIYTGNFMKEDKQESQKKEDTKKEAAVDLNEDENATSTPKKVRE